MEGRQGTCWEATPEAPRKDRKRDAGKTRRHEAEGSVSVGEPVDAAFSGTVPTWSRPVTCQEHKYIHNFLLLSKKQAPHSSYAIPTLCPTNRFLWLCLRKYMPILCWWLFLHELFWTISQASIHDPSRSCSESCRRLISSYGSTAGIR